MDAKQTQLLLNDLVVDNIIKKQKAILKLPNIAKTLGDKRTRNELIPFIAKELVHDENNFIIICLSNVIPKLMKYLGGSQYISLLFPILEFLAKNPDQEVREKVTDNLKILLDKLNLIKTELFCSNLLNKFYNSDSFICKDIFCDLMCHIYPLVSKEYQNELIQKYLQIVNHPNILLRKFAAIHLHKLSRMIPFNHNNEIIYSIQKFSQDDIDYIRALIPPCIIQITSQENIQKYKSNVLSLIKTFVKDKSWRVRSIFINNLSQTCINLDAKSMDTLVLPFVFEFLHDDEPEIKMAIIQNMFSICHLLENSHIIEILEIFKEIILEKNIEIKQTLAQQLTRFAVFLDKEQIGQYITPLFIKLSKGKDPQIRVNLFVNIKYLLEKVEANEKFQKQLMSIIIQLVEDSDWRVRIQIMNHLPQLYEFMPDKNVSNQISQILIDFSTDKINSVRENSVKTMNEMCLVLGNKKFEKIIFQHLLNLQYSQNYLHRIILLKIIKTLDKNISQEFQRDHIQKVIHHLLKDQVSNVRLNLVDILQNNFKNNIERHDTYQILQQLQQDPDPEIQKRAKIPAQE